MNGVFVQKTLQNKGKFVFLLGVITNKLKVYLLC